MKRAPRAPRHAERGFTLVAAIFLLVVLAMLGAFMVTISSVERWTTVGAAQGARAYEAAQSGIEWGIYQVINSATRGATPGCGAASATDMTNPSTFAVGLFQVNVKCQYWDIQEGGITGTSPPVTLQHYYVYSITSTASSGTYGNVDFFSRTLQVTVTDAP